MLGFHALGAAPISALVPFLSQEEAIPSGGWLGGYVPAYQQHREELHRAKLKKLNADLVLAEEKKARADEQAAVLREAENQKKHAAEMAALAASLQDEINRLRIERGRMIRRIDDEEAILAILLSGPVFH